MPALQALKHAWRMTNPWSPMILDHRAEPVPLFRLDRYAKLTAREQTLPSEAFDRVRAALLRQSTWGTGTPSVVLIVVAALALVVGLANFRNPSLPTGSIWPPFFFAGMFIYLVLTKRHRIPPVARNVIAAALLAERRCPSCAYDLSSTAHNARGLTTCPECGAAWIIRSLR